MKLRKIIGMMFFIGFICMYGFSEKLPTPTETLVLGNDLQITFQSLEKNTTFFIKDDTKFTSKDDSKVFFSLYCKIKNIGNETIPNASIAPVELVCVDSNGNFFINESYKAAMNIFSGITELKKGKTIKDSTFFLYDKLTTPVALMANRTKSILLIKEKDNNYLKLKEYLARFVVIENIMPLIKKGTFEELEKYMQVNNLDINITDKNGLSPFFYSVIYSNISVFDGLLTKGVDVNQIAYKYGTIAIQPIHTAVENRNVEIIRKLVNAGADLNSTVNSTNSPAVMVIKNNYFELLPLMQELGIDYKSIMIPMSGSPAITAYEFASKRNHTEILEFLKTLN